MEALDRLTRLKREDVQLVRDVRAEIEEAWASPDPLTAASEAIARLVPATAAGMIGWRGRAGHEKPFVMNQASLALKPGYATDGGWRSDTLYDPRRVEPMAGKVIDTDWLVSAVPRHRARMERIRERFMRANGFETILRVTVYRRSRLVAVVGHVRSKEEGPFSAADRSMLQAVVPDLCDGLSALTSLHTGKLAFGDLDRIVQSVPCPAVLCSERGHVLLANEPARLAYETYPEWLVGWRGPEGRSSRRREMPAQA